MELNAVGWTALVGAVMPMAALLYCGAGRSVWLSVVASLALTITIAILFDRRNEGASRYRHRDRRSVERVLATRRRDR